MTDGKNMRKHIRYRSDNQNNVVNIEYNDTQGKHCQGQALIINESHSGMAVVYIGTEIEEGGEVTWHETESISTLCTVIRCKNIDPSIYNIALEIKK